MELTSQLGTSERALRSLRDRKGHDEPDIILLDLHLPGVGGLESIPHYSTEIPDAKIIILTQSNREDDVLKAIMLGASGYLLKSSTVKQLTEGIRNVTSGGASLDAKLANFVLQTLKNQTTAERNREYTHQTRVGSAHDDGGRQCEEGNR